MARTHRLQSADAFAHQDSFNEQIYEALRKSPWWMLSVAFHVVLAVVLSAFTTQGEAQPARRPVLVAAAPAEDLEQEVPPEDVDTDPIAPEEVQVPDPTLKDTQVPENVDDSDQEFDEPSNFADSSRLSRREASSRISVSRVSMDERIAHRTPGPGDDYSNSKVMETEAVTAMRPKETVPPSPPLP